MQNIQPYNHIYSNTKYKQKNLKECDKGDSHINKTAILVDTNH